MRSEFRLVAAARGWEYTVLARDHTAVAAAAPGGSPLMVAVIEFESEPLLLGHLGVRVSMVSYPIVSVKKAFLDDVEARMRADPNGFQGVC